MANTSIFAAFERMWQHIIVIFNSKADASHTHDGVYCTESEVDEKMSTALDQINFAAEKVATISLPVTGWVNATNIYSQVVTVSGATANSKIDIYPTPEQLIELQSAGIALVAVNENGVVTVYAMNNKPTTDYAMQVTVTEVSGEA